MLLKEMVENISKMFMNFFLDKEFYKLMEMNCMVYLLFWQFKKEEIVFIVKVDYLCKGKVLQGYVYDELVVFMGGVLGNVGLFFMVCDVVKVYQLLIDGGVYNGKCYLSREICDLFLIYILKISRRGLGFDKLDVNNSVKSLCVEEVFEEVIGYIGFIGICVWVDLKNYLVFVFLSNWIYLCFFDYKQLMWLNICFCM